MSVPSPQPNRYSYAGNGVSVSFPFNSIFENAADLLVYTWDTVGLVAVLKVLNTDYTVTGGGDATGSVIFSTAPAVGIDVILVNSPAVVQTLSVVADGVFPATTFEYGIDYLTLLVRRCEDLLARACALPDWDVSGFSTALPTPLAAGDMLCVNSGATGWGGFPSAATRANLVLGFDSNGLPIAASIVPLSVVATALGIIYMQLTVQNIAFADSPFTAASTHGVINVTTTAGNVVVKLPSAASCPGASIEVVKITGDANTATIQPNGADKILGANSNQVINNQWTSIRFRSLGSAGWII